MTDKRSIKERGRFRQLAFQLQTAVGAHANEIGKEMIEIMESEVDPEEKESMRITLSTNINYPHIIEDNKCA